MILHTRREILNAVVFGAATITAVGCGDKKSGESTVAPEIVAGAAIIGVKIGERLVTLPHPAARIVGVILITTGTLVVTYLEWQTYQKKTEEIRLTPDESDKLKSANRITVQRKDGHIESVTIDEVKYGP